MKQPIDSARRFLALAERDIKAFEVLKKSPEVHSETVFFHAQQAIEKIFKPILIAHNIVPSRTHDLEALAYAVVEIPIKLPIDMPNLIKLNPFAVILRYEDMQIEVISREEASNIINEMHKWACQILYKKN